MKYSMNVHMLKGFQELEHEFLYESFSKLFILLLDQLIKIPIHQLEHKGQPSSFLITSNKLK